MALWDFYEGGETRRPRPRPERGMAGQRYLGHDVGQLVRRGLEELFNDLVCCHLCPSISRLGHDDIPPSLAHAAQHPTSEGWGYKQAGRQSCPNGGSMASRSTKLDGRRKRGGQWARQSKGKGREADPSLHETRWYSCFHLREFLLSGNPKWAQGFRAFNRLADSLTRAH